MINEETNNLFNDHRMQFTIYVVEQKFAVGKGASFFDTYKGTPSYIDSDYQACSSVNKIWRWIGKNIPTLSMLLSLLVKGKSSVNIAEIVQIMVKLFTAQEHQAVGPDIIDPIIL